MTFAIGLFVGMTVAFLIKALLEILIPQKLDLKVNVNGHLSGPYCDKCKKQMSNNDLRYGKRDYLCRKCSVEEESEELEKRMKEFERQMKERKGDVQ